MHTYDETIDRPRCHLHDDAILFTIVPCLKYEFKTTSNNKLTETLNNDQMNANNEGGSTDIENNGNKNSNNNNKKRNNNKNPHQRQKEKNNMR